MDHPHSSPPPIAPLSERDFRVFAVLGTALKLYTSHWPFMVGVSAVALIAMAISIILGLIPVIGQIFLFLVLGSILGVTAVPVLAKLRGENPAFPAIYRALPLPRLLEIIVCLGVIYGATTLIKAAILAAGVGSLMIAISSDSAIVGAGLIVTIPLLLVLLFIETRLKFGALLAVDVSSHESEPFSRLKESWNLTKGSVIKLLIIFIITNIIGTVAILIPIIGPLLITIPLELATMSVAYRALRGEPYHVPGKALATPPNPA
ncbi:MAG: hypothetical protein RLN76_05150 [Phycisphaeraceae bacterium]